MNRLSLPIARDAASCTVPRLIVAHSRITLRSPISSRVASPRYFLSCGSSPIEANWKMWLSSPIRVGPSMTACGPTTVPRPICTPGPITAYGPTCTPDSIVASGETSAVGWIEPVTAALRTTGRQPGMTIMSAPTTSTPSTVAEVEYFQIVRMRRSSRASRRSWSPGITGRRKRALSMPAK